jgi:hypothetical protein
MCFEACYLREIPERTSGLFTLSLDFLVSDLLEHIINLQCRKNDCDIKSKHLFEII